MLTDGPDICAMCAVELLQSSHVTVVPGMPARWHKPTSSCTLCPHVFCSSLKAAACKLRRPAPSDHPHTPHAGATSKDHVDKTAGLLAGDMRSECLFPKSLSFSPKPAQPAKPARLELDHVLAAACAPLRIRRSPV